MITSNQLRQLRMRLGLSSREAAAIVGISVRQWQKYEHDDNFLIPANVLEFFCLKLQLPFPPIDQNGDLLVRGHAKTIVFTSLAGGCGKTSLTSHIGSLLLKEGYRVLLLDASFLAEGNEGRKSTLKRIKDCHNELKLNYPEVKTMDEVCNDIEKYQSEFDYIIIDATYTTIELLITILYLNIVIVPTFLLPKEIKSTINIFKDIKYDKSITNTYALILGYDPCYIAHSHEIINNFELLSSLNKLYEKIQENGELLLASLISNNIDVFDAFTTLAYQQKLNSESFINGVTLLHQSPGCWAVKELEGIKNEIKRKIYVGPNI